MSEFDLPFKSAIEHAKLIHSKQISPVELLKLYLERIDTWNPVLNTYLALNVEGAIAEATLAEASIMRGEIKSPLHGVPFGIKDNEITKDIETTFGSLWMKGNIPKEDSVVVERIKAGGGIVVGKTNMPD